MEPQNTIIEKPRQRNSILSRLLRRRRPSGGSGQSPEEKRQFIEELHKQVAPGEIMELDTSTFLPIIQDSERDVLVEFYEDNVHLLLCHRK